jgi:hypothetical protein
VAGNITHSSTCDCGDPYAFSWKTISDEGFLDSLQNPLEPESDHHDDENGDDDHDDKPDRTDNDAGITSAQAETTVTNTTTNGGATGSGTTQHNVCVDSGQNSDVVDQQVAENTVMTRFDKDEYGCATPGCNMNAVVLHPQAAQCVDCELYFCFTLGGD